jgi:hypothetical protein
MKDNQGDMKKRLVQFATGIWTLPSIALKKVAD